MGSFDTIEETIENYKKYRYEVLNEVADYAFKRNDIIKRCYDGLLKYDLFADEKINR